MKVVVFPIGPLEEQLVDAAVVSPVHHVLAAVVTRASVIGEKPRAIHLRQLDHLDEAVSMRRG